VRYCLCILLLVTSLCRAQEILPLKAILKQVSEQHEVRFSYIDEELTVYQMLPPDAALSLESKIDYIEKHTRLRIEPITQNYYSIYNDKKMDKPLCGYLIDSQSGAAIENAAVSIPSLGIATASNASGYFELPVLTPNTIDIRHQGYQPRQLSPQELYVPDCPKIKLVVIVQQLPMVDTQRYLTSGITKNESGTITVRPSKFGILPGLTEPDVLQTMQQLPGITSIDETVSNINVRGGTHDQNLFLWNGIRMFQTSHFFGLISAFNPMVATHIRISKNGSSAFFGESVSSLVDMSSHTKAIDSCYNAVAVDMISANFFSKIKMSNKATIQAAGRRTYTDIVKTPAFKAYEDRVFQNNIVTDLGNDTRIPIGADTDFYFYDFSMQYHQKIGEKHELIVDGIGVENKVDFLQQSGIYQMDSYLSQQNFGASVNWKSNWNQRHESEIQGYFSWYELDSENQSGINQKTRQQNRVFNQGVRWREGFALSKNFDFDFGYQFDATRIKDVDFISAVAQDSHSHAIITEGRYKTTDGKTFVQAGLRSNYFERFDLFRLEPRLSVSQKLSEKWKLELLMETKSQSLAQITDQQQDFLGIERRRWALADARDIPLQKSRQFSLGCTYAYDGWLFSVDNFYKKIEGISSKSQGFQNQYESVAVTGDYRVLGSEWLVQKSFTKFYTWVSYAFNNNQYRFDNLSPQEFPNNTTISHSVGWAGIYEYRKLRFALGAKWHTGRLYTPSVGFAVDPGNPENSRILYTDANSARLDDFFQVNFSASRSWDFGNETTLSASISLWNILDSENRINRYYRVNSAQNTIESVDTYALGFTPNAGLRLQF
jgi:hypothetical protein